MKKLLLLILFFPAGWLHAQTNFKPGYVVTNSNETVYGEIDYRGDRLMGEVCKFRLNGLEITEYTPNDISAYRFDNGKYYVSKEISGKKVFLEFLIQGLVDIYYMRDGDGEHYYIDKAGEPISEIPYAEGIREVDGRQFLYDTKAHVGILNYYMQDAPEIQDQISKLEQPDHDNLIQLAKNYHYAVCKDGETCVVFEKKLPPVQIALDAVGGVVLYRDHVSSFAGGILLHVWMPRVNEKLYFRTGLIYSKYSDPEEVIPKYKIPLMIEYIYPKSSLIKPKFAYGLIFPLCTSTMAGLNIRLKNSMSLSLEYNVDFAPFFFLLPGPLYSHSFLGGLHFRF